MKLHVNPAITGWSWVKSGVRTFWRQPLAMSGLFFMFMVVVSLLSMVPLVIPGVILGISILAFASRIANFADATWGLELEFLRPGLPLVILGQFSYIVTIATLTISASLRRFVEYVLKHDDVWVPRRIDIARHWHAHHRPA